MLKKTFFVAFFSLIATTFAAHADPELVIDGKHKKWIFEEIENGEKTKKKIIDALLAHAPKLSAEANFPGDVSLIFPIAYGEDGGLKSLVYNDSGHLFWDHRQRLGLPLRVCVGSNEFFKDPGPKIFLAGTVSFVFTTSL